ncbi:hypothetical protein Sjap_024227 [Stephania japonica]|uniref:RNA helicase n=1 Tax=Stephania japonica TaxID=461633 RepID=A0AAP0HPX7_9MAGN
MDSNLGLIDPAKYVGNDFSDDSNAVILPKSKKAKTKEKLRGKSKDKPQPRLSKSQKRKLQKLEEEKKREALLNESIKTIQKHKIQEDARSLLLSSGKIGQVETTLEKRRRVMQLSKVGLMVPHDDRPSKKRGREDNSDQSEPYLDKSHSRLDHYKVEANSNSLDPQEESDSSHIQKISSGPNNVLAAKKLSSKNYVADVPKDDVNPLRPCNYKETQSTTPMRQKKDLIDPKVDSEKLADRCAPRPQTRPFIVHVFRPNDIEEKRKGLPIVMMEQEIMEAIKDNSTVIICGETGCGKTTQVPQFLYEAGYGSSDFNATKGIIGITQPRRVAVLATAKRVAYELGLRLGKEVGFQVRHDRRIGSSCSIKFMTDGILLRETQSDILLRRYSVVVLDEAHERSVNTDILIGMLSRTIQLRRDLYVKQQKMRLSGEVIAPENEVSPLKLVLMSATLRVNDFVGGNLFSEPPPVINVETRQFAVTIHFSKRTEIVDYIGQAYKTIMSIHRRLPEGGILVFVTGQREVEYLCKRLRIASRKMNCNISKGQRGKDTATLETNSVEKGVDMGEIDEAFDGHSVGQADRFCTYDEDPANLDQYDPHSSDDSEIELAIDDDDDFDDYEESFDLKTLEEGGDPVDPIGNAVNLPSLKAAFEALAGKKPSEFEKKVNLPIIPAAKECSDVASSVSSRKHQGPPSNLGGGLFVLPLYAMLPAAAQLRVFEKVREGERLVVVATNVAETSLTIPGIKYVVDTGREKVKKYNSHNGMETYEVQWISKASATQRAGRAGRTGPGHCYCLYSSAVFNNIFPQFPVAEISKIPVEGVVLFMKSMGIYKVANFPFPTPPEATALKEAECCLKALEAVDGEGKLTSLGKAMSQYPLSPRHSRMLLTVIKIVKNVQNSIRPNLLLGYAVAAAASLSLPNPFLMQLEGSHCSEDGLNHDVKLSDFNKTENEKEKMLQKKLKQQAKDARARFRNETSDALTTAYTLQMFELAKSPVEFCKDNVIHLKTMEEMSKLRKQLLQMVLQQSSHGGSHHEFAWTHGTTDDVEQVWRVSNGKHLLSQLEEKSLRQAICAGWADRVAKRVRVGRSLSDRDKMVNAAKYQACMVEETVFLHRRSSVAHSAPEFLVYSELVQTKRPYMHGVTSVEPAWLPQYAGSLCNFSAPLTDPKPFYQCKPDQVFCWVKPTFGPHLWELPLHHLVIKNNVLKVSVFAYALLEGNVLPCLKLVQDFLAAKPASILRPEALGQRRVGNLLNKLQSRTKIIYSRARLKEAWNENPRELYSEILDWFQQGFHDQFDKLWEKMHDEVHLELLELPPHKAKKAKRQKHGSQ